MSVSTPHVQHGVLVLGAGSGGISVAARLLRADRSLDVAIVDPAEHHCYQPAWTLVGAGVIAKEETRRTTASVIPAGATWIQDAVSFLDPFTNTATMASGTVVGYRWLVVALGIKVNWAAIPGLTESLGTSGVCSNYAYDQCEHTWRTLQAFKGGTALFTMPAPPIKCAGAPQKIMYLADDHFRRSGVTGHKVIYAAGTPGIFSVKEFAKTLNEVIARKAIETRYRTVLTALRADERVAEVRHLDTGETSEISYAMVHVTPPQGAPDVLRGGPLADAGGWCEVDRATLRHVRFPNVFSLGDCSSLPTSRTGAAIRKQAPVLVANLRAAMLDQPLTATYDGYSSCPLVTGYGKMVLAEFDYDLKPQPSFPFDTTKERWSMYQLKRHVLPRLYWNGMLKGRA